MKHSFLGLGALAVLATVTAPAQAQNLTWFGTTACWTNVQATLGANVEHYDTQAPQTGWRQNCNLSGTSVSNVSPTTQTRIRWDSNDGNDKSELSFQINEYSNSGNNDWPGGPASNASTHRSLGFASAGDLQSLYLGYMNFDDQSGTGLESATLSLNLFFEGLDNPVSYNLFGVTYGENQGSYATQEKVCRRERVRGQWVELCSWETRYHTYDILTLNEAQWFDFNVGDNSYSFRVAGFDSPWDDHSKNYCKAGHYDDLPEVLPEGGKNGSTNGKLCGEIRWNGLNSPSQVVPEPSTYALLAAGLAAIFGLSRRRRA